MLAGLYCNLFTVWVGRASRMMILQRMIAHYLSFRGEVALLLGIRMRLVEVSHCTMSASFSRLYYKNVVQVLAFADLAVSATLCV